MHIFCSYFTGESSVLVKVEADSNDERHDDVPRPYSCKVCDKRFRTKHHLNQHEQSHAAVQMYTCSQCEKQFATQHCLSRHMNVHSSKYKCTECGKCFGNKANLATHSRTHSGEKPFECTVYGKQFTTSGNLVNHSRIHSGEKPYKCTDCDKAFSQSGNLHVHLRSTEETNRTGVHCVTKASAHQATFRDTNVMHTAAEDLVTVVTVGNGLKVAIIWSVMFILTLLQSHTHVVTVRTVSQGITNSRHICWSHTMKVLGSHVTLVRRNSATVVVLRHIYFVMKAWSHLFAVNVQRVSLHQAIWNNISWNTQTLNSFAVVHVVNISDTNTML